MDGNWGPKTQRAYDHASVAVQLRVDAELAKAGISAKAIKEYQKAGGDSIKEIFRTKVVPEVQRLAKENGLNSTIMVAQLKLETGGGGSIPRGSFNWGGIKARPGEPFVSATTTEFIGGAMSKRQEPFRRYDSPEAFAKDYVERLAKSKRYSAAYKLGNNSMAAKAIATAGYATDPAYATKLARMADSLGTA